MARVPFAPLDNPRLQHLASAKNRQNGVLAQKNPSSMNAKASMTKSSGSTISNKRAHEPSTYDHLDCENVDPAMWDSPSKKTKGNAFDKPAMKPFTFSLSASVAQSMPPPSAFSPSASSASPASSSLSSSLPSSRGFSTPLRANMSSPRAPSTAPAGRSPKRKLSGLKSSRRISAPFSRVEPPSFRSASALPFSLDAVLSASLPTSTPTPKMAGATIAESMPQNWFFDIHEDTPDEEASNLMEHSTLTLDLSSDDEDAHKAHDVRGKENTPPEGYDAPTASRSSLAAPRAPAAVVAKKDIVRKKVVVDDMDDGSRSPLSDLETEGFIPDGLSKDSCVVVYDVAEKPAVTDVKALPPAPVAAVKEQEPDADHVPVVSCDADIKNEIAVWEDQVDESVVV